MRYVRGELLLLGVTCALFSSACGIGFDTGLSEGLTSELPPRVRAGGNTVCALYRGKLRCWGSNTQGQLGAESAVTTWGRNPGEMGDGLELKAPHLTEKVLDFSIGSLHVCAVVEGGGVKCWGINSGGRLGLGNTTANYGVSPGSMASVAVAMPGPASRVFLGASVSCATDVLNASLRCWGDNNMGMLGQGQPYSGFWISFGDDSAPDERPINLSAVLLGAGTPAPRIAEVVVGNDHVCARSEDGRVFCWGSASIGQRAAGSTAGAGLSPATMAGLTPAQLGTSPLGSPWKALKLAAGSQRSCAILENGGVKCWGNGTSGRLGNGSGTSQGDSPGTSGDSMPFVNFGTGKTARLLASSNDSTCVVTFENELKCWGINAYGEALPGSLTNNIGLSPSDMGDNLLPIDVGRPNKIIDVIMSPQGGFTCVLWEDFKMKCWGDNSSGQLGNEQAGHWGDNVGETAALAPFTKVDFSKW